MFVPASVRPRLHRAARGSLVLLTLAAAVVCGAARPASATVVISASGASVNPISAQATFTFVSGSYLDITLANSSTVATQYPADVLTSLYFDITSGTSRPNLQYLSASGRVFQVKSGTTDTPLVYTPPLTGPASFASGTTPSNLKAWNTADSTWQYKSMNSGSAPFLGFGVGTVGNSTSGTTGFVWAPNNFEGYIVNQLDFGLYAGDAATLQNQLENRYLVGGTATYRFLVLGGTTTYDEGNISPHVMFGFGTSPDAVLHTPEPTGLAACGLLGMAMLGGCVRPRTRRSLWLACGCAVVTLIVVACSGGPTVPPHPIG